MLSSWIAPKHLDAQKLAKTYKIAKPFAHISLKGFLREEKARAIASALKDEQFFSKESDLFKLSQTNDLAHTQTSVLKEFRAFLLSKEFQQYMMAITGVKLSGKTIDFAGAKYEDTEFLLCHDDQVTGRKIAYIFYCNPDFTAKDGGALALFTEKNKHPVKVVKRVSPSWNTLNFFTVSSKSWHSVEEVTSKKTRLSVGGWLH